MVSENSVMKTILVPTWSHVTGGWKKLQHKYIHNLFTKDYKYVKTTADEMGMVWKEMYIKL
jgi:hypothetical protein